MDWEINTKEIREIGLEKEIFLTQGDLIKEPKLYGFPFDEMGFLIELRSLPSDRLYPIATTISQEELQYRLRANKFGMEVRSKPYKVVSHEFIAPILEKYRVMELPDYTKNIYGLKGSHHTGVFPMSISNNPKEMKVKLTAGIHVHFSSRDIKTGDVIELPIEDIVREMDIIFGNEIERTDRIPGEWEPKTHGFEYRSLPCNVDIIKVIKESFRILREA